MLRAWLEGLREIRDRPPLRAMTGVVGLMALSQGIFVVLFVVFVTDRLGGGEAEVGVLRGVQAVGGLLGGALAGVIARRLGAARQLALALPAFGALAALAWNGPLLTTALGYYLALFALAGAPGVIATAAMFSILQQHAAPAARGRVLSSFGSLVDAFTALGMVLAGALAATLGPDRDAERAGGAVRARRAAVAAPLSRRTPTARGRSSRRARRRSRSPAPTGRGRAPGGSGPWSCVAIVATWAQS